VFLSDYKPLLSNGFLVAGTGSHKYLPLAQADWVDQESIAA
jgi:hypothetical protein